MEIQEVMRSRHWRGRVLGTTSGFSMIEVMIAGAILLIISLGLIPLFVQAVRNNETGSDYLQATNENKGRLEEASSLSINSATLALPAGATEGQVVESYAQGARNQIGDINEGWWAGTPTGKGDLLWTRTTRIHAFSITALDQDAKDFTLSPTERLTGASASDTSDLTNQNLKEVEVVLESEKDSSVFGGTKRTTFRLLKAF